MRSSSCSSVSTTWSPRITIRTRMESPRARSPLARRRGVQAWGAGAARASRRKMTKTLRKVACTCLLPSLTNSWPHNLVPNKRRLFKRSCLRLYRVPGPKHHDRPRKQTVDLACGSGAAEQGPLPREPRGLKKPLQVGPSESTCRLPLAVCSVPQGLSKALFQ